MFSAAEILVPDTLFDCIKNSHNLECFEPLNFYVIRAKRFQKGRTPEQKAAFKKKMSKVMKVVRRKYMDNITPEQKAAFAERMRKGQKRYWKNVSEEDRKAHIEAMSKGASQAWVDGRIVRTRETMIRAIHNCESIEHDIPRINTYSGVISASDLESL